MLLLNHITKQHTPGAQLQTTFARGWSHLAVLNAKSDKKVAGLRQKTAGGLSSSPLLGLLYDKEATQKCAENAHNHGHVCQDRNCENKDTTPCRSLCRPEEERPTVAAPRVSVSSCRMCALLSHWPWRDELAQTGQAGDGEGKKADS